MCGAANSTEDVHASDDASRDAAAPDAPAAPNKPSSGDDAENAEELAAMLAALRELRGEMKSAIESPLMPNRQQRVLELLRDRPALAHRCGVFPDVLPSLAENNPPVAAELLLRLARNHPAPSHNLPAHFDALVSMPTSLHSMEVVNRLVSEASELLPDDFVRAYVAECISACGDASSSTAGASPSSSAGRGHTRGGQNSLLRDASPQGWEGQGHPSGGAGPTSGTSRLVRLVCVFLQLLVHKNLIRSGTDVAADVSLFCVERMRTKEAAALYRLLRPRRRGRGRWGCGARGGRGGVGEIGGRERSERRLTRACCIVTLATHTLAWKSIVGRIRGASPSAALAYLELDGVLEAVLAAVVRPLHLLHLTGAPFFPHRLHRLYAACWSANEPPPAIALTLSAANTAATAPAT